MAALRTETRKKAEQTFTDAYKWYTDQLSTDGSFPGINREDSAAFYNVLYLFGLGGKWKEAEGFADWARKKLIEKDTTMYIDQNGIWANRGIYFKGWNVYGSHFAGIYDLSLPAIDVLLRFQEKQSGGFYCSEKRAHTDEGLIDLNATSLCGLAAIVTGRTEAAFKAADHVARVIELQPDLPKKFFAYYRPKDKNLLTEWPYEGGADKSAQNDIYQEKNIGIESDIDIYHFCLDNDKEDEVGAYAGLSMTLVFLCEAYRLGKKDEIKTAAKKLFDFFDYAGDKCWIEGQTTKVLWGLALLATFYEDKRLSYGIDELTRHLCDSHVPGKGWVSPVIGGDFDSQPYWVSLALTGDVLLGLYAALRYL